VTDNGDPVDVRTNGTHPLPDVDSSRLPERQLDFDGVTLDQRLDALMEMVRDWNWRTVSVETGHTAEESPTQAPTRPPTETAAIPVPAPVSPSAAVEADEREDTTAADRRLVVGDNRPQPIAVESTPRHARRDPVRQDPQQLPLEDASAPATPPPPPSAAEAQRAEADPPVDPPKGHSRFKVAALYLAAAAAVILTIGGIRLFA
jgi:hypothetical protein